MRAPIALTFLSSAGLAASAAVAKPPLPYSPSPDSTAIPTPSPINNTDDPLITANPRITDEPPVFTTSGNIVWDIFPMTDILSLFTPMPFAVPTPVLSQSQVETTYIPRYTLCRGSSNSVSSSASAGSSTTVDDDCRTYYEASLTTLCATTLTGLATRVPITACDQDVTFSSDFGAVLVAATHHRNHSAEDVPVTVAEVVGGSSSSSKRTKKTTTTAHTTPAPSSTIQLRTTYYLAPWQQLTAAGDVPEDVDVKVCHARAGNDTVEDCVRAAEAWAVVPVTLTTAVTSAVDVVATVSGGGRFLVETYHRPIVANATVVSLSTEMVVNYAYMAETITRRQKVTSTSSGTITRTRTVKVVSAPEESEADSTTVVTSTSTVTDYSGTTTQTDPIDSGKSTSTSTARSSRASSLSRQPLSAPTAATLPTEIFTILPYPVQEQSAPTGAEVPAHQQQQKHQPLAPEPLTLFPTDSVPIEALVSTLPLSSSTAEAEIDTHLPAPTRWVYLPQLQSSVSEHVDAASYLPSSLLGGAGKSPAPPKHEKGGRTSAKPEQTAIATPSLVKELESSEFGGVKTGTATESTAAATTTAKEKEKASAKSSSTSATESETAKPSPSTDGADTSSSVPLEAAESTVEIAVEATPASSSASASASATENAASATATAAAEAETSAAESTASVLELSATPIGELSESEAEASLAVDALGLGVRPAQAAQRWWANGTGVVVR